MGLLQGVELVRRPRHAGAARRRHRARWRRACRERGLMVYSCPTPIGRTTVRGDHAGPAADDLGRRARRGGRDRGRRADGALSDGGRRGHPLAGDRPARAARRRRRLGQRGRALRARPRRVLPPGAAARPRRLPAQRRRRRRHGRPLPGLGRAAHPVRHRHRARGPHRRRPRRRQPRHARHGRDHPRQRRGHGRDGRSRRDAPPAGRRAAPAGCLLPGRPRSGRDARGHGRHRRLGHDHRALRRDARQRALPDRRDGGRQGRAHALARPQVVGGLRPDAPLHRLRGNARRDLRPDGADLPDARGDVGGRLRVRHARGRRARGHGDDPARHPDRAHRAARRGADGRRQPPLGPDLRGRADALPGVPRQRVGGARAGAGGRRDRGRARRAGLRLGDRGGGAPRALVRPAPGLRGRHRPTARLPRLRDRRLRPDLLAGGLHRGDAQGRRRVGSRGADRRPRRRRQLPRLLRDRPRRARRSSRGRAPSTSA